MHPTSAARPTRSASLNAPSGLTAAGEILMTKPATSLPLGDDGEIGYAGTCRINKPKVYSQRTFRHTSFSVKFCSVTACSVVRLIHVKQDPQIGIARHTQFGERWRGVFWVLRTHQCCRQGQYSRLAEIDTASSRSRHCWLTEGRNPSPDHSAAALESLAHVPKPYAVRSVLVVSTISPAWADVTASTRQNRIFIATRCTFIFLPLA